MVQLKAPTLQHFSTCFGGSDDQMRKKLTKGQGGGSGVSYEFIRTRTLFDAIQFRHPFNELKKSVQMLKGELNVKSNLGALEALERYLTSNPYSGAVRIEKTFYPIARDLLVPVNPPLVLIHESKPVVLWPSFWKTPGKMDGMPSAIYGSIMGREIFSRPDYRDLELEFLDLSSPDRKGPRSLRIYKRSNFPSLSDTELKVEMDRFVTIFHEVKSKEKTKEKEREKEKETHWPSGTLFSVD